MTKQPKMNGALKPSSAKSPLKVQDPSIFETQNFKWLATANYVDYEDEEWGWNRVKIDRFFSKCLKYLQNYESLTWAEMKAQDHCHPAPLDGIAPKARKKITDRYGLMEDLYQVKAEGKCRLFGRKDRQNFYLIWHDENHTVYPGGK